jgi:hypothetical protein
MAKWTEQLTISQWHYITYPSNLLSNKAKKKRLFDDLIYQSRKSMTVYLKVHMQKINKYKMVYLNSIEKIVQ